MRQVHFIKASVLLVGFYFFFIQSALAQDTQTDNHTITVVVPSVTLLDLESSTGNKNFNADFVTTGEAGDPITAPANNNSLWLNYTSVLTGGGAASRTVQVSATPLVPGVNIKVTAGAAAAGGAGTLGVPTAQLTLTTTPAPIITGIGSAYTVTGPTHGHQLTYVFESTSANFAAIRSGSNVVTVTYTLIDNI